METGKEKLNQEAFENWVKKDQEKVWTGKNLQELEAGWDTKPQQKEKMELVATLIVGNSVVDIGCGVGYLYGYLKKAGYKGSYLGVEQGEEMFERARARFPEAKHVRGNLYDLEHVPKADTVTCLDVFQHQPKIADQPPLEPGFSNLLEKAEKCLIISLIVGEPREYIGGRGEIINWYDEKELEEKLGEFKYEAYRGLGWSFRNLYKIMV